MSLPEVFLTILIAVVVIGGGVLLIQRWLTWTAVRLEPFDGESAERVVWPSRAEPPRVPSPETLAARAAELAETGVELTTRSAALAARTASVAAGNARLRDLRETHTESARRIAS
ncbi:hypothetical protein [Schumannella sp. 10F1B-5-1]|uniref:hypothetical protein n=1 Tax=Schumannella sp. 10F1B-5-1 TaxID=2590780 RepID=UPI00113260B7|nr:hypothetical protein [Schumannella sp. 10F1B-5-1]TPW70050.1 hypothetical protein FJ658_13515 [Schumannella sp. 10F1B-5-1]